MEAPVHHMRTVLPALAQWDILEINVKVSDCRFKIVLLCYYISDCQFKIVTRHSELLAL